MLWFWDAAALPPTTPPQVIAPGPVLAQPRVTGPALLEDAAPPDMQVWGESIDGTDRVELEHRFGVKFQEKSNDVGSHTVQVPWSIGDEVATLGVGKLIRYQVRGHPAFLGLAEKPKRVMVAAGEEHDQVATCVGRGGLALWEQCVIYPFGGFDWQPRADKRCLNFAAPELDDSGWNDPVFSARRAGDDPTHMLLGPGEPVPPYSTAPNAWPDPLACWIWAGTWGRYPQPEGACYFRRDFASGAVTAKVFATADDGIEVWIDGVSLIAESKPNMWTETRSVNVTLSAGWHTIAIKGTNAATAPPWGNIANVICSVYEVDAAGTLGDNLVRTQANKYGTEVGFEHWKALAYPDEPPGFTPGEVLTLVIGEAQARGATNLDHMLLDFDAGADTDGNPWPTCPDVELAIGSTGLDAIKQLAATYVDVALAPGGLVTRMWVAGGRGDVVDVDWTTGDDDTANLSEYEDEVGNVPVNVLLVKWGTGTATSPTSGVIEISDGPSVLLNRRREAHLQLGYVTDEATAERVGRALLDTMVDPQLGVTATIEPTRSAWPYDGWQVGDVVTIPGPFGAPTPARVAAVTVTEDVNGVVTWTPELGTIAAERAQLLGQWLQRMAHGTLGGRALAAGPATILPEPVDVAEVGELPKASKAGPITGTVASTPYTLARPWQIRTVRVNAAVAGSTDSTIRMDAAPAAGGPAVTVAEFTLPAGFTSVAPPLDVVLDAGDVVTLWVVPGSGLASVTVAPEGTPG